MRVYSLLCFSGEFALVQSSEGERPKLTYNFKEAAARIGVSAKTISRMADVKQIRTIKVGGKRRIPLAELERFGKSPGGSK